MPTSSIGPDRPPEAMPTDTLMQPAASARPSEDERRAKQAQDRRLVTLWVVVTALWTAATLLRIDRVWVPRAGWDRVLHGSWLWLSLGVPPIIFALFLGYVRQAIGLRRRLSSKLSLPDSHRGKP